METGNEKGIKFSFFTKGPIRSKPLIEDGVIYFGSGDGNMYAVDKNSGSELWRFETGGPVYSSASIKEGLLFFSSRDHYLYAVQLKTGKLVWKYLFGSDIGNENYWDYFLSSPVEDEKSVFIGSGDGNLYSFDIKTGNILWKYFANSRIRSTPAVSGSKVVFGTMNGYVLALNKKGSLDWSFKTSGAGNSFSDNGFDKTSVFCNPVIHDSLLTIGARDFKLYILNINTGKVKWQSDNGSSWVNSTEVHNNQIFSSISTAGLIYSNDLISGEMKWQFKTKNIVFSSFAFANGSTYFGDLNGNIYGIDESTGVCTWMFPMGRSSFSSPVISEGVIYCSSDAGVLYAIPIKKANDSIYNHPRKIVFWEPPKSVSAYSYFNTNVDLWIRDYLIRQDYELMNADSLQSFMASRIQNAARTVVVFAKNKIPDNIIQGKGDSSLLRKYLNAGGKAVFLGINPLLIKCDPKTGALIGIDTTRPKDVLGISYSSQSYDNGHYSSMYTKAGNQLGLIGNFLSYWPIATEKISTVLGLDEYGNAAAWIKNYGGPDGTGVLQLSINPAGVLGSDFFPMRMAIEYGINW